MYCHKSTPIAIAQTACLSSEIARVDINLAGVLKIARAAASATLPVCLIFMIFEDFVGVSVPDITSLLTPKWEGVVFLQTHIMLCGTSCPQAPNPRIIFRFRSFG
ncbi:MAG: hypothetical protein CM15mP117_06450 [Alphaproteobacteria bacterium]|nr:MAG: hypothetical protein CM15mP117_06450 [Alphaproteobacteria bacterium]